MANKYVCIDVETTGLEPSKDRIIEIAIAWKVNQVLYTASNFINPKIHIPSEISAIHHIVDEDVNHSPTVEQIVNPKGFPKGIIVAHNSKFDKAFLPLLQERQWLCTYRCALHLWPEAPNHKNQTLRYWLGLKPELPSWLAPHRALYDVLVTNSLLEVMLQTKTLEELILLQEKPALLKSVRFGKYRGQYWDTIPTDYLKWMLKQDESGGIGEDERHTARYWLKK